MDQKILPWHRPNITAAVAITAWSGLALQLYLSLRLVNDRGLSVGAGLVEYFGYFTILTNIIVASSLSLAGWGQSGALVRVSRSPSVASGILTSILLVGAGYHFLLRDIWNPVGLAWVADQILHYVTPLLCAFNWWYCVPATRLTWVAPLTWCAWPIVYTIYALLRGEWLGRYPYPFIDVGVLGYERVLLNVVGLLVIFVLLGVALVALMRVRSSKKEKRV